MRRLARGEHTFLRHPTLRDRRELLAMNRASRELHRGYAAPPTTPSQFAAYLQRARARDFEALLVCRREDDAIVGVVNLSQIFRGPFNSAYMGYYAGACYAGRGYLSEAVGLTVGFAFRRLRLHRIEANIQPDNEASRRVAQRNGFALEGYSPRYLKVGGRWRDHERWAVLADSWRPAAPPGPPRARRARSASASGN